MRIVLYYPVKSIHFAECFYYPLWLGYTVKIVMSPKISFILANVNESVIRSQVEKYYNLSVQHYADTKDWYVSEFHETAKFCHAVNPKFTLIQWCGVIAALSPSTSWDKNVYYAIKLAELTQAEISEPDTLYNFGVRAMYRLSLKKSLQILSIEQNELQESAILKILNAPKTSHFFLNGLYPNQETGSTIDSHMAQIFCPDLKGSLSPTLAAYRESEKIFNRIAREKGLLSHQLQAMVWCAKVYGVPRPKQLKLDINLV